MNQTLGRRGKLVHIPRNAVIKTRPKRDQQIGMVHHPICHVKSMHPQHSVLTGMRVGQRTLARQGMHHRTRRNFQQRFQRLLSAGQHRAIPCNDHWALGLPQQLSRLIQSGFSPIKFRRLKLWHIGRGLRQTRFEIGFSLLRIFGKIDQHGARASRLGNPKCFGHHVRELIGAAHVIDFFGCRRSDVGNIRFLKRIRIPRKRRHLAVKLGW